MYSYIMERSSGLDGNNIIAAIMKERKVDIQGAYDYAGDLYRRRVDDFMDARAQIPSFGSTTLDADVSRYVKALQHMPIGNIVRYFI
jgi:hypothetical protein